MVPDVPGIRTGTCTSPLVFNSGPAAAASGSNSQGRDEALKALRSASARKEHSSRMSSAYVTEPPTKGKVLLPTPASTCPSPFLLSCLWPHKPRHLSPLAPTHLSMASHHLASLRASQLQFLCFPLSLCYIIWQLFLTSPRYNVVLLAVCPSSASQPPAPLQPPSP